MKRNLTLVVCSLLVAVALWRPYDPRTNAAEMKAKESTVEGGKENPSKGLDKPSGGTKVALLDLGAVFKVHRDFVEQTALMKKEVEVAEEQVRARRDAIKSMNDKLKSLAKTSEEYRSLSEEIVRFTDEFKTEVDQQKKEFTQRESQIYAQVNDNILANVKKYAAAHQIDLVMRINNDEVDRANPQSVIRELNKSVLFHSGLDITADIIVMVNGL